MRSVQQLLWILFLPLSWGWAAAAARRRRRWSGRGLVSRHRVISVGNIHSGGSGKTPLVLEIARRFASRNPVILSRGYGGTASRTGERVDPGAADGARRFGDEPWMLAQRLGVPVFVGRNRSRWIRDWESETDRRLVILDDGFQHVQLERDLDIVAIHSRHLLQDAFCLPLGELREPLSSLRRASAIVLLGERSFREWERFLRGWCPEVPVFPAERTVEGLWQGDRLFEWAGAPYGAFCGIAHGEGFISGLQPLGRPAFTEVFPDHYNYGKRDVEGLAGRARELGLGVLVTTDKDWYKVSPMFSDAAVQLVSLRIGYRLPDSFWEFVEGRVGEF